MDDTANLLSTTPRAEQDKALTDKLDFASVPLGRITPRRNLALDAYRGFVMLLMMGEVLRFSEVSHAFPTSWFWKILSFNQTHVDWAGCSLHDMIQPSFSFLVGVALPYSLASRLGKGASKGKLLVHAMWRALVLVALGIFLRSMNKSQTYFTFEDTLTQIGLGYVFLFSLGLVKKERWLWIALGAILLGYWLAWGLYSGGESRIQLAGRRRSSGLAPSLFRLHGALEQEREPGECFRPMVPESVSKDQPVCLQRGRIDLTLSFIPTLGTMLPRPDRRTDG